MSTTNENNKTELVVDQVEDVPVVALAASLDGQETMWASLKSHPMVLFYTFILQIGPFLYGYDVIVMGAIVALPGFLSAYGTSYNGFYLLPAEWQSLWTAFVQLGSMTGSIISGFVLDRYGRRVSYFLGGLESFVGVAIAFSSGYFPTLLGRRLTFFFAKIVMGMGMGTVVGTCQTYISEISPPKLRGPLLGMYPFMSCVGQMVSISIIFKRVAILDHSSFEIPFATQFIFSGLAMIVAFIIPESPVFLVSKLNPEAAKAAYRRLNGASSDSHAAVTLLQETVEHEHQAALSAEGASFIDCFKGTNLRRTLIILLMNAIPQFFGIALIANGTYFTEIVGLSASESFRVGQIGVGSVMVATVISWFTMSTLGRRFIIVVSPICAGCVYIAMGVAGVYKTSPAAPWVVAVALILVGFCYGMGLGSASPVLASEVSAVRLRAKSSALGFFMYAFSGWVFAYATPYMFNPDSSNLGGKTGFIFAGLCFLAFVVSWWAVPETKAKSYAELDYLFEMRTPTRDFKKPFPIHAFTREKDTETV